MPLGFGWRSDNEPSLGQMWFRAIADVAGDKSAESYTEAQMRKVGCGLRVSGCRATSWSRLEPNIQICDRSPDDLSEFDLCIRNFEHCVLLTLLINSSLVEGKRQN